MLNTMGCMAEYLNIFTYCEHRLMVQVFLKTCYKLDINIICE